MSIADVPLDAWVVVFSNFDRHSLVDTFNRLEHAGVFQPEQRLNIFWSVMSEARMSFHEPSPPWPYTAVFKRSMDTLLDLGVPRDTATRVVRDANGDLEESMYLLGW